MKIYKIVPAPEVSEFFEQIAKTAGLPVEKVIEDSLLRFAGDLAIKHFEKLTDI